MTNIYSRLYELTKRSGCTSCTCEGTYDLTQENVIITLSVCEPCCINITAVNKNNEVVWYKQNLDVTNEPEHCPFSDIKNESCF